MTAEALGVSVAPSFFQTCVTEGKIAKPEEVQKFKVNFKLTPTITLVSFSCMVGLIVDGVTLAKLRNEDFF
jgi:hypothetical protein